MVTEIEKETCAEGLADDIIDQNNPCILMLQCKKCGSILGDTSTIVDKNDDGGTMTLRSKANLSIHA